MTAHLCKVRWCWRKVVAAVLVGNLRIVIRELIWGFPLSCFRLPVTAGLDTRGSENRYWQERRMCQPFSPPIVGHWHGASIAACIKRLDKKKRKSLGYAWIMVYIKLTVSLCYIGFVRCHVCFALWIQVRGDSECPETPVLIQEWQQHKHKTILQIAVSIEGFQPFPPFTVKAMDCKWLANFRRIKSFWL